MDQPKKEGLIITSIKFFLKHLAKFLATGCMSFVFMFAVAMFGGQIQISALNFGPFQVDVKPPSENQIAPTATTNTVVVDQPQNQIATQVVQATNPPDNQYVGCYAEGMFSLVYLQYIYEPGQSGYAIYYDDYGLTVFDPHYYGYGLGEYIFFTADASIQRNVWLPLNETRFQICVDNSNYVYARFK